MTREDWAVALYNAMAQPETIWWEDLTPEMQASYLRGADMVLGRIDTSVVPNNRLIPAPVEHVHDWQPAGVLEAISTDYVRIVALCNCGRATIIRLEQ